MFPEVRQDRREGSPTFGAVARKFAPGDRLAAFGDYGVMDANSGGGFVTAAEVAEWTVLS